MCKQGGFSAISIVCESTLGSGISILFTWKELNIIPKIFCYYHTSNVFLNKFYSKYYFDIENELFQKFKIWVTFITSAATKQNNKVYLYIKSNEQLVLKK